MRITVITCTHNPRSDYFARVLDALCRQTLSINDWEYVVIDNASVRAVEDAFDLSWHPRALILREETLGLTPARIRGIREAAGEILVFVDDDNVLDPDFLEQALRIADERPYLGAWSGQCRPGFEVPPAEWTRKYWGNLVIRQFDRDVWSNLPRLADTMPCGAGLVVRREVARCYVQLHEEGCRTVQLDRAGGALLSGGDNDLAACASEVGLGMGLISAMRLTHLIAPERLTLDYLKRLAEGISYSSVILDAVWGGAQVPRTTMGRMADRFRLMRLSEPHRSIAAAYNRGRDRARRFLVSR